MIGVQRLLDDSAHPDDEVGGHHMHQTQVGDTIAQGDVEAGIHDDGDTLEDDEDDGQEAVDGVQDIQTVGVQVNDEVGDELKEVINEGSNPKDKCSLPQEAASMRLDIVKASW